MSSAVSTIQLKVYREKSGGRISDTYLIVDGPSNKYGSYSLTKDGTNSFYHLGTLYSSASAFPLKIKITQEDLEKDSILHLKIFESATSSGGNSQETLKFILPLFFLEKSSLASITSGDQGSAFSYLKVIGFILILIIILGVLFYIVRNSEGLGEKIVAVAAASPKLMFNRNRRDAKK